MEVFSDHGAKVKEQRSKVGELYSLRLEDMVQSEQIQWALSTLFYKDLHSTIKYWNQATGLCSFRVLNKYVTMNSYWVFWIFPWFDFKIYCNLLASQDEKCVGLECIYDHIHAQIFIILMSKSFDPLIIKSKRPMGHITHLRQQFKSINTYDFIIMLIWEKKPKHY